MFQSKCISVGVLNGLLQCDKFNGDAGIGVSVTVAASGMYV